MKAKIGDRIFTFNGESATVRDVAGQYYITEKGQAIHDNSIHQVYVPSSLTTDRMAANLYAAHAGKSECEQMIRDAFLAGIDRVKKGVR